MPIQNFGPWRPDEPALGSSGIPVAKNVIPETKGYGPFPSLGNSQGSGLTGLPLYIRDFKDSQGAVFVFAANETDIFRLNAGTGLFEIISRVAKYTTPTNGGWGMVQYGDVVYAANGFDDLQSFTLGSSTIFADVPGAAGISPRRMAILRDFIIAGPMFEAGNDQAFRVRWSAFGNPNDWAANPRVTQADFQDIPDLGLVKGITGGEFATVLLEHGVVRVEYTGGRAIMQFDEVEGAPGCVETNSIIRVKGVTYYLSPDGMKAFNGSRVIDIGVGKFDDWLERELQVSSIHRMSAVKSSSHHLIMWGFPGQGSVGGKPNVILAYNYETNEASFIEIEHDLLGYAASPGLLLDDIVQSLETLPAPLDSPYWLGGARFASAINNANLFSFNGPMMEAEWVTREITDNKATTIHDAEVLIDGECAITLNVGVRQKVNDVDPVYGPDRTQQVSGIIPCRDLGPYVRMRVRATGNDWFRSIGLKYNEGGYR